jgi:hypothetical protein
VNTVRASLYKCGIGNFDWPQSPWLGLYVHPFIQKEDAPLDEVPVMKLIADYEHDYPKGRYLPEVCLSTALVHMNAARFTEALQLLTAILGDPQQHDLHYKACQCMAYIFIQLIEPEQRMNVISALRVVPAARRYLDRFVQSRTCGGRLMLLNDWITHSLKP